MGQQKSLITKRGNKWQTNFASPTTGKPVRQSLKLSVDTGDTQVNKANEKLANERAAKILHDMYNGKFLDKHTHYWGEAAEKYIEHTRNRYRDAAAEISNLDDRKEVEKTHVEYLREVVNKFELLEPFLGGKKIEEINQKILITIREHLINERKVKPKTANRYMSQIRRTLTLCRDVHENDGDENSKWLKSIPTFPMSSEGVGEPVTFTPDQFWKLYQQVSDLHKDFMIVGITLGFRSKPMKIMKKSWVFLDAEIPVVILPSYFQKNKKPLSMPLPEIAVKVIRRAMARNPESEYVFNTGRYGKPISSISSTGWYSALEKVGLKGTIKFHDMRHLFAIQHVIQKTPDSVTQKLGGWKTPSMVARYSDTDNRALLGFMDVSSTFLTQSIENEDHKDSELLLSH